MPTPSIFPTRSLGKTGIQVTPIGLGVMELSGGASLQTNIRLFHHNVSLACAVAVACARPHEGG